MLGSRFIFIKVLSDDFADVDFCEELCYHSRPKKQNSKGEKRTKDECRKAMRGGKSGSRSQAVQRGRLRHRRAFRSGFPIFFSSFGAWACLPLYSYLNLMVLSVLPDIGAVFIADAEFTIIHTGFRHAEHFYDFGTFPTKMKCL